MCGALLPCPMCTIITRVLHKRVTTSPSSTNTTQHMMLLNLSLFTFHVPQPFFNLIGRSNCGIMSSAFQANVTSSIHYPWQLFHLFNTWNENALPVLPLWCYKTLIFSLEVVDNGNTQWPGELLLRFLHYLWQRPITFYFGRVTHEYVCYDMKCLHILI